MVPWNNNNNNKHICNETKWKSNLIKVMVGGDVDPDDGDGAVIETNKWQLITCSVSNGTKTEREQR